MASKAIALGRAYALGRVVVVVVMSVTGMPALKAVTLMAQIRSDSRWP
jgi:hypothetical protein